jgi:type I restriction enzyme S subunit
LEEQHRIVAKIDSLLSRVQVTRDRLARVPIILKKFREGVLAAAFSGELSAEWRQNMPEGESAQESLRKLRKVQTSTSNEVVPPHELPPCWEWTTLGECFDVSIGGTPSRKAPEYWGGDVPWVSSGEVKFTRIKETREKITRDGLENSNTKLNPIGTVLIGMIGEGKTRGQAAILDIEACNNQNAAAIRVSLTPIPPEFVFYWLWSQYEATRARGAGNSQPALNKARVELIPMPFPPIKEQVEVARRIAALFKLADAVERRVASSTIRAEKLAQAILAKAFCGELVETEADLSRAEGREYETAEQLLERVRGQESEKAARPKPAGKEKPMAARSAKKAKERKPLMTVLKRVKQGISAEQLFQESGFDDECVEEFYRELRVEIDAGRIVEERPNKTDVVLKAV